LSNSCLAPVLAGFLAGAPAPRDFPRGRRIPLPGPTRDRYHDEMRWYQWFSELALGGLRSDSAR
jgi:hypothetical protein